MKAEIVDYDRDKLMEVLPGSDFHSKSKVRIDTLNGAQKYFKERFSLFVNGSSGRQV